MAHPLDSHSDAAMYLLAVSFGVGIGVVDVELGDLLFTALLVLGSTMFLGALRPDRPWRWMLVVAVLLPIVRLLAFLFLNAKPDRSLIYGSLLEILPAAVGAYGGALGRGVVNNILLQK